MASAIRLHIHHAGPRIDRAGPETTGRARELYCRLALETCARTLLGRRGTIEMFTCMGKRNDDEDIIVPSRHDAF